ncbi:hypothetical protein [Streptomyces chilikensis]|uniref:hypothetical protein n=1 Tax=Streptomyces chilikensis TaxID=1194079 RepID=UPI00140BAB21|nr:hypothetical protein [Streptomyces chilikensis]
MNEALLPVVEKGLEEAAERLGAALTDKGTETDLVSVLQAELMRRVLPQFSEAVRAGVLEGIRTRQMHLAQLAVLHRQALEAKSMQAVLTRLDHEVAKAGLQIVGDSGDQSLFNIVEEQPGVMKRGPVVLEVITPAYVDRESGRLVERGWLRATPKKPSTTVAADRAEPGRKHKAAHTNAHKKQYSEAKEGDGDSPPRKKAHRGQGPRRPWAGKAAQPHAVGGSEAVKSVEELPERPGEQEPEQGRTSRRSTAGGGQPARTDGSRGDAESQRGTPNGRAQQELGFKQTLRAGAYRQRDRKGTR